MGYMDMRAQVKSLYATMREPRGTLGMCPVTGAKFVWGEDPIAAFLDKASRAWLVRLQFAEDNPGLPQFPLSYAEREKMKARFGLDYLLALYARSIAVRGYQSAGHPSFERYVQGCMALAYFFDWAAREAPELIAAYPPQHLPGLEPSGYVNVPRRP